MMPKVVCKFLKNVIKSWAISSSLVAVTSPILNLVPTGYLTTEHIAEVDLGVRIQLDRVHPGGLDEPAVFLKESFQGAAFCMVC